MAIRKVHDSWHYRFMIQGKTYTKNTGFRATEENRPQAELFELTKRALILRGEPLELPIKFEAAGEQFLEWADTEFRESTARSYRANFVALRKFFVTRWLPSIKPADIERYKATRRKQGHVAANTLRNELHLLKTFSRYARHMGWITRDPTTEIALPKLENGTIHILSSEEESRYLNACERLGANDLADVARLALLQGIKPNEALSLSASDVHLDRGEAEILRDGRLARKVHLKPESCRILASRLDNTGPWVFPSPLKRGEHIHSLRNLHAKVLAIAGFKGNDRFRLDDLRITFAARCAKRGMPAPLLTRILGTSLGTVSRYLAAMGESDLAEVMERFA